MVILDKFGFKVFRLRKAKDNEEYLLFNKKKKICDQYNFNRLVGIVEMELKLLNIDVKEFATEHLKIDGRVSVKSIIESWVKDETILIDYFGYKPVEELVFEDETGIYINTYRKSDWLKKNCEVGEFPFIHKLIMNLVSDNDEEYDYLISWVAWQIQNPLRRLPTSIILQGEHGTGKTKFCELILKPLFNENFREIGQTDINSEYNEYIYGKQLIVANEVIHNDNKFLVPDKLKNYVTDEFISINRKYKNTIYIKNYSQWIFVSNNSVPLKIEKGDRRYSVFKSRKLVNGFDLIRSLLDNYESELEHFTNYLKTKPVDFDYVATPLHNKAKEEIIKAGHNSIEEFYELILEVGGFDKILDHFREEGYTISYQINDFVYCNYEGCYIRLDILYKLYLYFCQDNGINMKFTRTNFTRHFSSFGYDSKVMKFDGKSKRCLIVTKEVENERKSITDI